MGTKTENPEMARLAREVQALRAERDALRAELAEVVSAENSEDVIAVYGGARAWASDALNLADAAATLARGRRPEEVG